MTKYKTPNDLKIGESFCSKCGWRGILPLFQNHVCFENKENSNVLNNLLKGIELIWKKRYYE